MAGAKGIVKESLLLENGGHILLSNEWVRSLLSRMGFVKRIVSTSGKILESVSDIVKMEDIPCELILYCDQTDVWLLSSCSWTMEKKGMKRVALSGTD